MFICPALSGKDGWWFLQNYCPLELTPLRNYRLRMYHVSCMYTLSELGNRDNGRAKGGRKQAGLEGHGKAPSISFWARAADDDDLDPPD